MRLASKFCCRIVLLATIHIHPYFRVAQFSWIALFKLLVETIFADQIFSICGIQNFTLSAKTVKIVPLEILTCMVYISLTAEATTSEDGQW